MAVAATFTPFIFFVSYQKAQIVSEFHYASLERLSKGKHSSLLIPFISYKEIEVL